MLRQNQHRRLRTWNFHAPWKKAKKMARGASTVLKKSKTASRA